MIAAVERSALTTPLPTEALALDRLQAFAQDLDHPEGIVVSPRGTIHVGGEAGQIYAVEPDGSHREIANTGGGMVLGLAADGEGRLYVCDETQRKVFRTDPAAGPQVEPYFWGTEERALRCPNWPAFGPDGTLYLSDSGDWGGANGLIWAIRPGRRAEVWSERVPDFPNGIALAPDNSRLYGVQSTPGAIFEIPIAADGSAAEPRILQQLGMAIVPDGIAVATDDSLLIACYRPDAIYRWSASEGLSLLAADPQGTVLSAPANVAFTGPEREILLATNLAARHLSRGELGLRGAPLFHPSGGLVDG
jgi:gluconolactonase